MSAQFFTNIKGARGFGYSGAKVVGDNLVMDEMDGTKVTTPGKVIGNVRGPKGDKGAKGDKGDPGVSSQSIRDDILTTASSWSSEQTWKTIVASVSSTESDLVNLIENKADAKHYHDAGDVRTGVFATARIPQLHQLSGAVSSSQMAEASSSLPGAVRLASLTEAAGGKSSSVAVTPAGLAAWEAAARPNRSEAVIIGASNCVPGTWTDAVCSEFGWTQRNYASGSSGFTQVGQDGRTFVQQMDRAIADPSLVNSNVGVVFVAGGGNDITAGQTDVYTQAVSVFRKAVDAFPNARIIAIPALWRAVAVAPGVTMLAESVAAAARDAGGRVEVIWHAWEWLYSRSNEMNADAVHPNGAGYARFARMISAGVRGQDTGVRDRAQHGWGSAVDSGHSLTTFRLSVQDGIVRATGNIVWKSYVTGTQWVGTISTNSAWARPSSTRAGFCNAANGSEVAIGAVRVGTDGVIEATIPSSANQVRVEASWPIGQ